MVAVACKRDRLVFEEKFGGSEMLYRFECLDFKADDRRLNAFYAEFPRIVRARVATQEPDGVEFVYLLSGSLSIGIGEGENTLRTEDALYFDSSVIHGYRAVGNAPCAAVIVTLV